MPENAENLLRPYRGIARDSREVVGVDRFIRPSDFVSGVSARAGRWRRVSWS